MTDLEWLEQQLGRQVTDDEVDSFSERISIMMMDGEVDENAARNYALNAIFI